jgi:hypothetical protein
VITDIYKLLDEYRSKYDLKNNAYYFNKLAVPFSYDSKEIIFVKRLLQKELEKDLRKVIINKLFNKYVTNDEKSFSDELYMNEDQLKIMINNNMHVGGHGFNHYWLEILTAYEQEIQINLTRKFLKDLGMKTNDWVMAYPFGSYNQSLIEILKRSGCILSFTTHSSLTKLNKKNAFTLERFDTNQFPKA